MGFTAIACSSISRKRVFTVNSFLAVEGTVISTVIKNPGTEKEVVYPAFIHKNRALETEVVSYFILTVAWRAAYVIG